METENLWLAPLKQRTETLPKARWKVKTHALWHPVPSLVWSHKQMRKRKEHARQGVTEDDTQTHMHMYPNIRSANLHTSFKQSMVVQTLHQGRQADCEFELQETLPQTKQKHQKVLPRKLSDCPIRLPGERQACLCVCDWQSSWLA